MIFDFMFVLKDEILRKKLYNKFLKSALSLKGSWFNFKKYINVGNLS